MAQTTHGLLVVESNSIEYVPRLSPPAPRNSSHSSTSSIDSGSTYFPQGETAEGANPPSLPTFYPSGFRDATPSSKPEESPKKWGDILFHGWRVVLLSCTPLLVVPLSSFDQITLQGLNVLLVLIPLSVRSTRIFVWTIKSTLLTSGR